MKENYIEKFERGMIEILLHFFLTPPPSISLKILEGTNFVGVISPLRGGGAITFPRAFPEPKSIILKIVERLIKSFTMP